MAVSYAESGLRFGASARGDQENAPKSCRNLSMTGA
jgi:hypothetical protein